MAWRKPSGFRERESAKPAFGGKALARRRRVPLRRYGGTVVRRGLGSIRRAPFRDDFFPQVSTPLARIHSGEHAVRVWAGRRRTVRRMGDPR